MKFTFALFLSVLCVWTSVVAQNAKTVAIPGTRISLEAPEGYTLADKFSGIKGPDDAGIIVMEVPGAFDKLSETLTKESLEEKGAEVLSFDKTEVDGFDARLAVFVSRDGTRNLILAFGDSDFSVMFTGISGSGGQAAVNTLKEAMLTATYNKSGEIDPMAGAWFEMDDSATRLKFARTAANMFIYSANDGETSPEEAPILMVAQLPMEGVGDLAAFAEGIKQGFEEKGMTGLTYEEPSRARINGYTAYEVVGSGAMNDKAITIMLQLIQHEGRILMMQTLYKGDRQSFQPEMVHELTKSVKFK
ncbi:MAG: hypothetical protein WBB45_00960 [Cyclobacteriaceae bacterium]